MSKYLICFFILLFIGSAAAQDERYYRKIYTNEYKRKTEAVKFHKDTTINVASPYYRQDLNDDGLPERIRSVKRDGVDWFELYDYKGDLLFEYPLETQGIQSSLYKVRVVTINKVTRALILHFFEGYTKSTNFEGRARIYLLSFENKDFNTLKMYRGAYYFQEKETYPEAYWQRNLHVNVLDYNRDGTKEVSITFGRIAKLFSYLGNGKWGRL